MSEKKEFGVGFALQEIVKFVGGEVLEGVSIEEGGVGGEEEGVGFVVGGG
jgi:hypothetical protein